MTIISKQRWRPSKFLQLTIAIHAASLILVLVRPDLWPGLLGVLFLNHLVITAAGLWPRSRLLGPNWTALPQEAARRGWIALTIDDGPDPEVTPQVLDLLDEKSVQATFFCIASKAAQYPELCREILRRGHAVENHSLLHSHTFSLRGVSWLQQEIKAAQDLLMEITQSRPVFFRPPAGLRNPFLDYVLRRNGLTLASWSARGFDTCTTDAKKIIQRLLKGLRPGAILLLHDGNAAQVTAGGAAILAVLPQLIAEAAFRNLRFVTLREALAIQDAS